VLPARWAGALYRIHFDDGQRFAGLLAAATWQRQLLETHDEDWFRNPRAIEELRASVDCMPATGIAAGGLSVGARELRRRIEELLA
jgi:hypothetical protein